MDREKQASKEKLATTYLQGIASLALDLPIEPLLALVDLLEELRKRGGKVLLCGNGGSSATAAHWANDLSKSASGPGRPRLKAMALAESIPLLTALANDLGYEEVFAEQVLSWIDAGDVLIVFSSRGNSPNLVRAIECAGMLGATTVGLIGFKGGRLRSLVDLALVIDSASIEQVEDMHMIVGHLVSMSLRRAAESSNGVAVAS